MSRLHTTPPSPLKKGRWVVLPRADALRTALDHLILLLYTFCKYCILQKPILEKCSLLDAEERERSEERGRSSTGSGSALPRQIQLLDLCPVPCEPVQALLRHTCWLVQLVNQHLCSCSLVQLGAAMKAVLNAY